MKNIGRSVTISKKRKKRRGSLATNRAVHPPIERRINARNALRCVRLGEVVSHE